MKGTINHVHLADGTVVELSGNMFRKQLLRIGEWVHPNDPSKKLTITKSLIKRLIENFKKGVLDKVPVPDTHTRSTLANTGYVVGLEETEDGLDGILQIEDEDALGKLRKKLIPGVSVSFTENYVDKETGENVGPVLFHAALVDNPYLKGMRDFEPVALGEEDEDAEHIPFVSPPKKEGGKQRMDKEQLITALKEEHGIDVAALSEAAGKFEQAQKDAKAAQDTLTDIQKVVGERIELSDDVSVLEGVKKLAEATKEKETEATKLADRIEKLEKEGLKRDAKDAVASLVRDGKVKPADAEIYESLYLSDKSLFENVTKTLTAKVVELGERGYNGGQEPGEDEIDEQAEIDRISKELGL